MKDDKEQPEFIDDNYQSTPHLRFSFKDLIDGKYAAVLMIKHLPYMIFLTFCGLFYIHNRYQAQNDARTIERLETQADDLRTEALMTSRDLTQLYREQNIIDMIEERQLDIKPSVEPPMSIKK